MWTCPQIYISIPYVSTDASLSQPIFKKYNRRVENHSGVTPNCVWQIAQMSIRSGVYLVRDLRYFWLTEFLHCSETRFKVLSSSRGVNRNFEGCTISYGFEPFNCCLKANITSYEGVQQWISPTSLLFEKSYSTHEFMSILECCHFSLLC